MSKINWTPEMDALLGTAYDWEVAAELGLSTSRVKRRRHKLDIPCFRFIRWTPKIDVLLGTMSDKKVATKLGLGTMTVWYRREELGIPSWRELNRILPKELRSGTDEASRIYTARRKHMKQGVANTLTYKQWLFACEWFDNRCAYCGAEEFLTEDHLVPLSKGGPRIVLNILPACWKCNNTKHTKQAHLWIYEKFGMTEGKRIVERIVAYLSEVRDGA